VLKERAGIEISVLDPLADVDSTPLAEIDGRFFAPVLRVDGLTTPANRLDLLRLAEAHDVAIHTLDDLLRAMDAAYETAVAAGAVGIKVGVAYARPLQFAKVARADAERAFNRLSAYPATIYDVEARAPVSWGEARPLHDYLMHVAVQRALEHGLPIQIHTGLQEGNGNRVTNSHPLLLVDLLMEYPEARFDLFHAGYPFQSEMATLGKNFPNAYLDMCWVYAISPWVARQTLHEWIETVPANKIFGFGGDYIFVEGAYAHARLARGSVARVLAEKVEDGYLSEGEAMGLAQKLLHDNAAAFFGL
jgi:predicted TIM-barrel fold metal-dependent hydrolase